MAGYELLKKLQEPQTAAEVPLLPAGVKYEEYEVDTFDRGTMTVHIPLSEAEQFEEALMEYTVIVRAEVRNLLRKHRGIIGS